MEYIRYAFHSLDGCAKCYFSLWTAVKTLKGTALEHTEATNITNTCYRTVRARPVPNKELENRKASGMNIFGPHMKI